MSSSDNKKLVRHFYEQVVNTGNVEEIDRFISPDYVEVHENERYPIGLNGMKEHVLGVRQTYPDLHLTIEQQIAEEEWVVSRVTMRGTHQGEWQGTKPTGKAVKITGVNIDRVVDGRIVEHGGAANLFEPLLRIGAIKVVGGKVERINRRAAHLPLAADGLPAVMRERPQLKRHVRQAKIRRVISSSKFFATSKEGKDEWDPRTLR